MALQVTANRNSASLTDMFDGATYSIDSATGLTILSALFADISCIYYSETEPTLGGYTTLQGAEIYVSTNFSATVNIPAITAAGTYYFMYIDGNDKITEVVEVVVTDDSGSGGTTADEILTSGNLRASIFRDTTGSTTKLANATYSFDSSTGLTVANVGTNGNSTSALYWVKAVATANSYPPEGTASQLSSTPNIPATFIFADIKTAGTYSIMELPGAAQRMTELVTVVIEVASGGTESSESTSGSGESSSSASSSGLSVTWTEHESYSGEFKNSSFGDSASANNPFTMTADATTGLTVSNVLSGHYNEDGESYYYFGTTAPVLSQALDPANYTNLTPADIDTPDDGYMKFFIPTANTAGTYYLIYGGTDENLAHIAYEFATITIAESDGSSSDSGSGSEPGLQVDAVTTTEGAYQSYLSAAEYSADETNGLVITGVTASSVYWSTDDKAIGTSLFSPTSATSASASNDIFTIAEINAPGTYYLYTGVPGGYVGEKVTLTITATGGSSASSEITDFSAERVGSGVLCSFTLPAAESTLPVEIDWQRTTGDPTDPTTVWETWTTTTITADSSSESGSN